MRKYRIQEYLNEYKNDGKIGKEYKEKYREIIEDAGISKTQFYDARNWKIEDTNTLSSTQLYKIAFYLQKEVGELINIPEEYKI